jgi:quinol monooxygenase YgiN
MRFVQSVAVRTSSPTALKVLMQEWHEAESGRAPGYLGSRLLADRDDPTRFMLVVEFSSAAEAELNNDRSETQAFGARLAALIDGTPRFRNYDEVQTVD